MRPLTAILIFGCVLVSGTVLEAVEPAVDSHLAVTVPGDMASTFATASHSAPLSAGYDDGFFLSGTSPSDADTSFLLKINSRLQLRHTVFDSQGNTPHQNDIEFERLRLVFSGHAYTPDLTYFLQLDGDSDQGETVDWLDAFVSYDAGHQHLELQPGALGVRLGKWRMPYSRARREAGFKLQFADRSMASVFFDINRSIGGSLYGKCNIADQPLNWEAAVFNGFQTQGARPVRSGILDRNFGTSARVFYDPWGEWGTDGEPDLNPHECPAVRIGAGFAFSRVDAEGLREFSTVRVVDSGATLSSLLPMTVNAYNVFLYAVDANVKYQGISLLSEVYFRQCNGFAGGAVPSLFDHGLLIQGGCFVLPQKLELIARMSRIVGNSGTLGGQNQSADEVAGGIVWYIRGHKARLTFDVTHVNGAPIRDTALNLIPGDDGLLYRTQFQLTF